METVSVLVFFFFLLVLVEARCTNEPICKQFSCGGLNYTYPFFSKNMSQCGLSKMNCVADGLEIELEQNSGIWYKVENVSQANTITITYPRLNQTSIINCRDLSSFSLPDSPWLKDNMTTLYKCNNSGKNGLTFANCRAGNSSYYFSKEDGQNASPCSPINIPQSWVDSRINSQIDVKPTFSLHIDPPRRCRRCLHRGGNCTMYKEVFRCVGGTKERNYNQEISIGLGIGGSLILIIILVALFVIQRIYRRRADSEISRDDSKSDVEFSHVFFKIPIFSYTELQEATDNFSKDRLLGDGDFGTVYYGKLRDGREVAVKRLYEHNNYR